MVYKFILLNILETGAVSALVSDVKAFFLHYMYTNQMYVICSIISIHSSIQLQKRNAIDIHLRVLGGRNNINYEILRHC
jgi:hypothetical protein